jgi:hypothetical protein
MIDGRRRLSRSRSSSESRLPWRGTSFASLMPPSTAYRIVAAPIHLAEPQSQTEFHPSTPHDAAPRTSSALPKGDCFLPNWGASTSLLVNCGGWGIRTTPHPIGACGRDLCGRASMHYRRPSQWATNSPVARGCGAVGSAQPCQGWGRGFESRHPLDGAEALTPAVEWPSGEATACKAVHTGSIPVSTSEIDPGAISSAGERFPDTEEVTGSIPVSRTTFDVGQASYVMRAYSYAQRRSTPAVAADVIGNRLSLCDRDADAPHQ